MSKTKVFTKYAVLELELENRKVMKFEIINIQNKIHNRKIKIENCLGIHLKFTKSKSIYQNSKALQRTVK